MGSSLARMTVYHGGYKPVAKPEIRKGRNTKDFGIGFYCTIIKEQAQRWAKRYDKRIVSVDALKCLRYRGGEEI